MKFSVTSYAVSRSMTLDELIPRLGVLGYDGVEVWGKDEDTTALQPLKASKLPKTRAYL